MSITFRKILEFWRLPQTIGIDLDDPATTLLHAQIILEKPYLRNIYTEYYQIFSEVVFKNPQGTYVELGSGGGFIKKVLPQVKTSDILDLPDVDFCFSAGSMPFEDQSIDGFFMINVFHHAKSPVRFLQEIDRCLRPGGAIIMIEPANTLWGRFIYQTFHHEPFDPHAGWFIEGTKPLSEANGALPWIVFCRDQKKFAQEFPALKVISLQYDMPFRYVLSGGVSFKQLFPAWTYFMVRTIERGLSPLNKFLGMFMKIKIQKTL